MQGDKLKFGSLFSGIGGFDLGFTRSGMECVWQVEIDKNCRKVLERHYPDVMRYEDVRECGKHNLKAVDLICGGDPCPIRSRARSNGKSLHPDLSGYFLAVVAGLRPRWVVRENVPAPDDKDFSAALDYIGYRTIIIRMDAASFLPQQRIRDFVIGCNKTSRESLENFCEVLSNGAGPVAPHLGARQVTPALTTHRTRYDTRDCYIWDSGKLRILDGDERERLAGFPAGWTSGLSETSRARMFGNAVVPQIAEWIGRRLMEIIEWR